MLAGSTHPDADGGPTWKATIPGTLVGLKEGLEGLGAWLRHHGVQQDSEDKAHLVFEEIVTNIVRYGFTDASRHQILVGGQLASGAIRLTFDDGGKPFDPRQAPPPPRMDSLSRTTIGGRGLLLVRKAASTIDYQRTPEGRNLLAVTIARD